LLIQESRVDVKLAEADKFLTYQDCYDYLYEKIFPLRPADYGSKYPKWPGLVGIEVEMLPLYTDSLDLDKPRTVPLYDGGKSLVDMLYSLQEKRRDWRFIDVPEGSRHLMNVLLEDDDQLSFEPGGQLEFSSKPYPCLTDALARTRAIQGVIDEAAKAQGISILQVGMNPWRSVDEIGLQMNKPRYQAMNAFFARQGVHGQRMMRQTCTIQLNLDFGQTEEILAKRYIVGNLIAPFATGTFANSPILKGELNGLMSNRGDTWQHMDKSRTGFPKLDEVIRHRTRKACVEAYLDWTLQGRVIFSERHGFEVMDGAFRFGDWLQNGYKGLKPTLKDLQTHLSLQFPEVRARGFLELRSVDAQHRFWQAAPSAYYTGIIYDDKSLDETLDLLLPEFPRLMEHWSKAPHGLHDKEIARLSKRIVEIAIEGFSRMPPCYHSGEAIHMLTNFYRHYTEKALTPADEMVRKFKAHGKFSGRDLIELETDWAPYRFVK
jgi:glutamate--cysteine ligase